VPLPEGQEEQEVAPIMLEKVPDGQGRQDEEEEEEEGEGEYVPAVQRVQP